MSKQTINLGTSANDGTGDPLRTALDKANDNFDELYARPNPAAWSANMQSFYGAADFAAMRGLLSLVIGTNVQAYDAALTAWAAKTVPSGVVVGATDAQTLANKTLTAPVVNSPTGIVKGDVGLGNVDNASNATERAAAATLTNKTLGSGCVIPWSETIVLSAKGADAAAGNNVARFVLRHAVTLGAVYASCDVAPTGSTAIIDINEAGATILSTKLSIDAGETDSATAATPAVISDTALASGAVISFDLDQVGSSVAGQNYIVTLAGTRTL